MSLYSWPLSWIHYNSESNIKKWTLKWYILAKNLCEHKKAVRLNLNKTQITNKQIPILIFNVLSYVSQKQFVPFGLTRNVIFVIHLCIIMMCLIVHYHWFTTTPLNSKPNLPNVQRQKSALRWSWPVSRRFGLEFECFVHTAILSSLNPIFRQIHASDN